MNNGHKLSQAIIGQSVGNLPHLGTAADLPTERRFLTPPVPHFLPLSAPIALQDTVIRNLRKVFDCHGAVPMSSSSLGYAHHGPLPAGAVRMLLPTGPLLALRYTGRGQGREWSQIGS